MHTVELLEEALELAEAAGFKIRQEWLGGGTAGACQLKGQNWLFIDLAASPSEQLDVVVDVLRHLAALPAIPISPGLRALLRARTAA
jgi:hypothetical protein